MVTACLTVQHMPTAAPIPETGCPDKGSNINNPILEFKIDSNTDIANTVMTPPKTLPQDTLPFSSAKLNFFIIVRFLINTMICISIKKTASKEYLFDEYLSFQQTFVLKKRMYI